MPQRRRPKSLSLICWRVLDCYEKVGEGDGYACIDIKGVGVATDKICTGARGESVGCKGGRERRKSRACHGSAAVLPNTGGGRKAQAGLVGERNFGDSAVRWRYKDGPLVVAE